MYEADLKGADAQVVAWEAEDDDLKEAFRKGRDIHAHNAEAMWGVEFTRLDPHSYAKAQKRQECKHTVHGINYGCSPRTTAIQRGWLVREAERFHTRWLSLHPGILNWHNRIKDQIAKDQTIKNAFGFRRRFFDRIDGAFTEALAWVPQSTVALTTYKGALQLEKRFWPLHQSAAFYPSPEDPSGISLQTHDSLCFQFKVDNYPSTTEIREALAVKIPYSDPLYIPWDLKSSTKSWGDMSKCE